MRYPAIAKALEKLPDETVIDGEVVAFDDSDRPSFNTLQNYGSSTAPIFYYAFDVLILAGTDLRFEPLERRRELLRTKVLSKLKEPVRYPPDLDASLPDLIRSVRDQGMEGLVAKRRKSVYEAGQRSGACYTSVSLSSARMMSAAPVGCELDSSDNTSDGVPTSSMRLIDSIPLLQNVRSHDSRQDLGRTHTR